MDFSTADLWDKISRHESMVDQLKVFFLNDNIHQHDMKGINFMEPTA